MKKMASPGIIRVVDSHTGGEPTRVIVSGGPDLQGETAGEKLKDFQRRYDFFRSAVCEEPRGSEVIVGALLIEPSDSSCVAGVLFFNNVGYLGMCGHGVIGLVATLSYLGRMTPGVCKIETPVGIVSAQLHSTGDVSVQNVPSYRHARDVSVEVAGIGLLQGDVAWGGNWFFLCDHHGQELDRDNIAALTEFTWKVRQALWQQQITGREGQEIDHIELFVPSKQPGVHSKNFVLCPGKAYDRSPCGTGTSAKLACLYSDGKLREGEIWKQESIIGSVFEGQVYVEDQVILPIIRGTAFVNAEATLILDPTDPFCWGIRSDSVPASASG